MPRGPSAVWLRAALNRWRRRLWHAWAYRMVFGEQAADGRLLPHTRIAPSTCIDAAHHLQLADHVFIGQFNFIDASAGLVIEEGVQITHFVSIITHSTHRSVRLMGQRGSGTAGARPGDVRAPVRIGAYSFIGPHSLVEAGSTLGRGTLVCAYSRVRGSFPDFAVLRGDPAVVVGDTRERDAAWLERDPELAEAYRAWAGETANPPSPQASAADAGEGAQPAAHALSRISGRGPG